jgi:hypothetical protein
VTHCHRRMEGPTDNLIQDSGDIGSGLLDCKSFAYTLACYMYVPVYTCLHEYILTYMHDRAITQAVSRRFPKAAVQVLARVWSCGIYGGQSGSGASFLRVFWFPQPILIPPTAPHL